MPVRRCKVKRVITFKASAKNGMTLDEIAAFIDAARGPGIAQTEHKVKARVAFGGGLKSLEVEIDDGGDR